MAISADAIARGAIVAVSVILLSVATPARCVAQSASTADTAPAAPAPSIVTGGGLTLHSVNLSFPRSDNTFPGGAAADTINNDCLICHSAGMVLDQATLSPAAWQGMVNQMHNDFKAPFAVQDSTAILDYLVNLKKVTAQSAGRQPDPKHGAVIVAQGTAAGAPPVIPYLAGQYAHYIAFTLQMWQEGFRKNSPDAMGAIAKTLDDQDILAVAAYYQQVNSPLKAAAK